MLFREIKQSINQLLLVFLFLFFKPDEEEEAAWEEAYEESLGTCPLLPSLPSDYHLVCALITLCADPDPSQRPFASAVVTACDAFQ